GMYVLPRLTSAQRDALEAEAGDPEEDGDADRVEQSQHRGVTRHEIRRDEQGGRPEPDGVTADGDVVATYEPPCRGDQGRQAGEGVEAPWHRAQQRVAQGSHHGRDTEDVQPEPGPLAHGAHPAAASGRPPKRRWRVRKSATARARSAAPKSGHMVSVKYSSA